MTNATQANPVQVATYVRSASHKAFGRGAWNTRLTRSAGHASVAAGVVVFTREPRTTPRRPSSRINRATVQRATVTPSRRSWRHTLRTPYTR